MFSAHSQFQLRYTCADRGNFVFSVLLFCSILVDQVLHFKITKITNEPDIRGVRQTIRRRATRYANQSLEIIAVNNVVRHIGSNEDLQNIMYGWHHSACLSPYNNINDGNNTIIRHCESLTG